MYVYFLMVFVHQLTKRLCLYDVNMSGVSWRIRRASREANPEKLPKKGCRGPSVLQAGN